MVNNEEVGRLVDPLHSDINLLDSSARSVNERLLAAGRAALSASADPIVLLGPDGRFQEANRAFHALTGSGQTCQPGTPLSTLFPVSVFNLLEPLVTQSLSGEPAEQTLKDWTGRGAGSVTVRCEPYSLDPGCRGAALHLIFASQRIASGGESDQSRQEVALLSGFPDQLFLVGQDRRILSAYGPVDHAGRRPEELAGYLLDEVAGYPSGDVRLAEAIARAQAGSPQTLHFDSANQQVFGPGRSSSELRLVPVGEDDISIADGGAEAVLATLRHGVECPERIREYHRAAMEDGLTSLANRRAFLEQLDRQLLSVDAGASLLFIDLDDFKKVNDFGGHEAGDEMLKLVARALEAATGSTGLVGRIGGDEFAVLLYHGGETEAVGLAQRIVDDLVALRLSRDGVLFRIGCSIGVVAIDPGFIKVMNAKPDEILRWADTACLKGKASGGRQVSVHSLSDDDILARCNDLTNVFTVENALENQDLALHSMPVMNLNAERPVMQEILLRFKGRDNASVHPKALLTSAERHGLMDRVDRWIVDGVLDQLEADTARGPVAINLSVQSIGSAAFLNHLKARLTAAPDVAALICFELSETHLVRDRHLVSRFVSLARDLGCKIAIDNFSGSWSTFSQLGKVEVDWLKIDGTIIRDIARDPVQRAILLGIVSVSRQLGVALIAEHIEDAATVKVLCELGLSYGQGYQFSRPTPWPA